jgi:hypothetical protein
MNRLYFIVIEYFCIFKLKKSRPNLTSIRKRKSAQEEKNGRF